MKDNKFSKFLKTIKTESAKYSPEILLACGLASGVTAIIFAIKATPKAAKLMDEIKESRMDDKKGLIKDVACKVAPLYIPTVICESVSIGCVLTANSIKSKRNAALATALTLSETLAKEYSDKVIEVLGEKKEQAIRDEIAKDKIAANPVTNNEVIIASAGNTLFYDPISGRYFTSDIETIRKIQNDFNKRLLCEDYLGLNELYYEFGLRPTEQGNQLGFNMADGFLEFRFSAQLADDGRPCIVLDYQVAPRYGYSELY